MLRRSISRLGVSMALLSIQRTIMGSPSRNVQYHPPRLSKTGSTSPSLTVHLCLHTAPGNRECAQRAPARRSRVTVVWRSLQLSQVQVAIAVSSLIIAPPMAKGTRRGARSTCMLVGLRRSLARRQRSGLVDEHRERLNSKETPYVAEVERSD